MFLGIDMFSGKYAMQPQYSDIGTLTGLGLTDGTYDHLFLSSDTTKTAGNLFDDWEFSTKINADYSTSMDGGNTGFSLKNTDTVIIKRREKGTMDWVTIFTIPINKIEDFNFIKEYYYGRSGVSYDFMIISSIGGIQNSYVLAECASSFEGLCLADQTTFYQTVYNLDAIEITRNLNDTVLHLLNDTYPVVISNDSTSYDSGTVSACFLKMNDYDAVLGCPAVKYREEILNWLSNKKAKILKLENGRIKLIRITGMPSETDGGHPDLQKVNFDFVEIGNVDSEADLYRTHLSDIAPDRW